MKPPFEREDHNHLAGEKCDSPHQRPKTLYLVYVCESCGWPEKTWLHDAFSISDFAWTKRCNCPHCGNLTILYRDGVYSTQKLSEPTQEFLYIFRADNGLYKIGRSSDPSRRLKAFSSGPVEVTLVWQQEFTDAQQAERVAHHFFRKYRVRGEWFRLNPEQVKHFIAINTLQEDSRQGHCDR